MIGEDVLLIKKPNSLQKNEIIYIKNSSENCYTLEEIEEFLREFSQEYNDELLIYSPFLDESKYKEIVEKYNIKYEPCIFFKMLSSIKFYGDIRGELSHNFKFLRDYITNKPLIKEETKSFFEKISDNITVYVLSSNMCPACPMMIDVLTRITIYFPEKINLNIFNVQDFPSLIQEYLVTAVPRVVILKDETVIQDWVGAISEKKVVEKLKEVL